VIELVGEIGCDWKRKNRPDFARLRRLTIGAQIANLPHNEIANLPHKEIANLPHGGRGAARY
jgi:hypothetical protein